MRRLFHTLLAGFVVVSGAFAQYQDCSCPGSWVAGQHDGSEQSIPMGPILIESKTSVDCVPFSILAHSHSEWKTDICGESGGSCASLAWIEPLQALYDNSGLVSLPVEQYTVPPGWEAREQLFYTMVGRVQSFDCVENNVVLKTLSRARFTDVNMRIEVRMLKIQDCPVPEPPVGPGTECEVQSR